ncbi:MAG: hypothetical protein RJB01_733, partial [Actinomycetota bacterium]
MVDTSTGVNFPQGGDGARSTSATGRAIFADSIRATDPAIAARIEHTKNWRHGYLAPLRDIVVAASRTSEAAVVISRDGLDSAHRRFVYAGDSGDVPLLKAVSADPISPLTS